MLSQSSLTHFTFLNISYISNAESMSKSHVINYNTFLLWFDICIFVCLCLRLHFVSELTLHGFLLAL